MRILVGGFAILFYDYCSYFTLGKVMQKNYFAAGSFASVADAAAKIIILFIRGSHYFAFLLL